MPKIVVPLMPAVMYTDADYYGVWDLESWIEERPGGRPAAAVVRTRCPLSFAACLKVADVRDRTNPAVLSVHQAGAGFAALAELERACGGMGNGC